MDSLEQQYKDTCTLLNDDKTAEAAPYPSGWFKVISGRGNPMGLGFYCPSCKLVCLPFAPDTIQHCGNTLTESPRLFFNLPELDLRKADAFRARAI